MVCLGVLRLSAQGTACGGASSPPTIHDPRWIRNQDCSKEVYVVQDPSLVVEFCLVALYETS
jgi:hypothetical protein